MFQSFTELQFPLKSDNNNGHVNNGNEFEEIVALCAGVCLLQSDKYFHKLKFRMQ
jgi:hypothetical protein